MERHYLSEICSDMPTDQLNRLQTSVAEIGLQTL